MDNSSAPKLKKLDIGATRQSTVKMYNRVRPAISFVSPPTLQTLASQELALVLCRHIARYEIKIFSRCRWELFTRYMREAAPMIEGVPSVVEKMINNCLYEPVALSFQKWCFYHRQYVFYDVSNQYFYIAVLNCMDEFVLKPDGTISFLLTAKNILNRDNKLHELEKYKIACINCLVDDVERFWPFVSNNSKLSDGSNFEISPLVHYWTNVMRGEFGLADSKSNYNVAIDSMVFHHLIERAGKYSRLILPTWHRLKPFISLSKFLHVIRAFAAKCFREGLGPNIDSALYEIWKSAPAYCRDHVLSNIEVIEDIFRALGPPKNCPRVHQHRDCSVDMKFFIALLTNLSSQSRNALWCQFWPNIIIHANLESLRKMMRLCFHNSDGIAQFKERNMMNLNNIEDFCYLLIVNNRVSKLAEYLKFCSSNRQLVMDLKRQILQSSRMKLAFIKSDRLNDRKSIDLDNFIDGAFLDKNDANNYRMELFGSYENLRRGWFYEMISVRCFFACSALDLLRS